MHGLEQGNVGSGQAWPLDPLLPHPTEGRVEGRPEPALCSPLCQDQRHCCEGAATVAKIRAQLDSKAHDLSYHFLPPSSDFSAQSLQSGPGCPWQLPAGSSLLGARKLLSASHPSSVTCRFRTMACSLTSLWLCSSNSYI